MIKQLLLIFIGGGLGSVSRYLMGLFVHKIVQVAFPIGTLLVNVLGSFLIGFIYALFLKEAINHDVRLFLAIGFCGGFTTFSSFSFDSLQLLRNGQTLAFAGYIIASILLCFLFVWLGDYLGKIMFSK